MKLFTCRAPGLNQPCLSVKARPQFIRPCLASVRDERSTPQTATPDMVPGMCGFIGFCLFDHSQWSFQNAGRESNACSCLYSD